MRHETYIDVLKSVFLTVVCLVFFPLLLPAISPSQDPNGVPENLLIFGEEEEEQSASIHNVDSLSDASSDDPEWYIPAEIPDSLKAPNGVPRSSVRGFGEEEAERSASISIADSRSGVSSDANGAPENLLIFGEEEAERSASISIADSRSGVSADDRSPMRAATAACMTDSILTFNIDSVLTEATTYDYDAVGRTIRTTVWQYNTDGSRTGKSKTEYAFDASGTQIYTGTFAWDANTNDWKGTAKSEFVYNEAHKMESNITYTWVNNTWLPSQALTYAYDAAGRETEFTTYTRNASLNRLVPSKQRLQTWYNASKKTLEINYTAYSNGAWSAGTRKDYQYDAKGNQIEYTYYASYSGGNWVGSTHELWTYNAANKKTYYEKQTWSNGAWANSSKELWEFNAAGKQTLHEKYTGSGTTWTITLREISGYDDAGNNTLVENYQLKSNVWTGTKKEEYTFNAAKKKINTYKYKWVAADNAWVYNTWAVTDFDAAGNAIETANYSWTNNAWKGTGTRTLKTYNGSKKVTEQITQTWPSGATDWVNATRNTTTYQGAKTTQEAAYTWQNEVWVGTSRSDWHYNTAGQNDTIKIYTNNGTDWIYSNRTVNTYDSRGNNTLTHNAQWNGTQWVMTTMNRLDIEYNEAGTIILSAAYTCNSDSIWVGDYKVEYAYNGNNLMIASYQYQWTNNDWQCIVRAILDYNESNQKILEERNIFTDGHWVGDSKMVSAYDALGRQTLSESYTWSNNRWAGLYKSSYAYDANGNMLESWTYTWQDTIWQPSLSNIYIYDSQNRIVEEILSRRNAATGFAPDTKEEYAYDANNLLILSNRYSWNGVAWQIRSSNEKIYDDNDNILRREINGSWTATGVQNTYTDNHYFYSCDAPTSNNGSQPRTPTGTEEDAEYTERILDNNNENTLITTQPVYNLQGQSVDPATYHGIVIQNGRKYILR